MCSLSAHQLSPFKAVAPPGALANLLAAKRVNAGYNVFAYTFASPGTTTSANTTAAKYCCIFNIVNEDDLVPQLPMRAWSFKRCRNGCYTYRTGDDAYYLISYDSADVRDSQYSIQILLYPANVNGLHYTTTGSTMIPISYYSRIYRQPAFFMQLIAAFMESEISEPEFGMIGIAQYMSEAKAQLSAFAKSGGIFHPHDTISYYLLAAKLS